MKRSVAVLVVVLVGLLMLNAGCVVALGNRGTDAEDIRAKLKELSERLTKVEEKVGLAAPAPAPATPADEEPAK
ncbi:MAG: hypothetical protein RDV41_06855 [Planctomycetota bacterium]|nr:hypothetical protein [Planctomycetota bacterium]